MDQGFKELDVFDSCGPTCGKSGDYPVVGEGFPILEQHLVFELLRLPLGENGELLIGGRVDVKWDVLLGKCLLESHGHVDGMSADAQVQIIGKQSVELEAQQSSLGQ